MILSCTYILLFCILIFLLPFFKDNTIKPLTFVSVFLLKVLAGFFLTWIYTCYYHDRQTSDIFKYFDDAKIMFSSVTSHRYFDYIKMLTGIGNDSTYFDETYYNKMNHWYRHYDYGTYNDNHTIIRFNALSLLFSFGSFNVHTVFICFVCLLGLTALFKVFSGYFTNKKKLLFAAIYLAPSVLLWSSGVLKEGILLFALGFLFYAFFNVFINKVNILLNVIFLVASTFLILINKNYLLMAVIPALLCFICAHKFKIARPLLFYIGLYASVFFAGLLFSNCFLETNLIEAFSLKQRDFINISKGGVFIQNDHHFVRIDPDKKIFLDTLSKNNFRIKPGSSFMYWTNEDLNDTLYIQKSTDTASYHLVWDLPIAGSTISISKLDPNLFSLLKTAPFAFYNSLCKPSLFSSKSFLERFSALENAFVLVFLIICILFKKQNYNRNLFALCFFICLIILLLIGYTTPVAGAIVRYKVPIMPFLLMCGILILDEDKLKLFLKKTKT
ncbi:MAG: hypothetical protein ACYDCN_06930 [Bacteroidia bacterium]